MYILINNGGVSLLTSLRRPEGKRNFESPFNYLAHVKFGHSASCHTMGKIYQVIVIGLNGENMTIDLCNTEEQMKAMTVLQLKNKLGERLPGRAGKSVDNIRLIFTTDGLDDDERTLVSYGVQHKSAIQMVIKVPGGVQL
ncbi:unnamed protein product [Gadus morhua 'NCC']